MIHWTQHDGVCSVMDEMTSLRDSITKAFQALDSEVKITMALSEGK